MYDSVVEPGQQQKKKKKVMWGGRYVITINSGPSPHIFSVFRSLSVDCSRRRQEREKETRQKRISQRAIDDTNTGRMISEEKESEILARRSPTAKGEERCAFEGKGGDQARSCETERKASLGCAGREKSTLDSAASGRDEKGNNKQQKQASASTTTIIAAAAAAARPPKGLVFCLSEIAGAQ